MAHRSMHRMVINATSFPLVLTLFLKKRQKILARALPRAHRPVSCAAVHRSTPFRPVRRTGPLHVGGMCTYETPKTRQRHLFRSHLDGQTGTRHSSLRPSTQVLAPVHFRSSMVWQRLVPRCACVETMRHRWSAATNGCDTALSRVGKHDGAEGRGASP